MITEEMLVGDVLDQYPSTAQIFKNFGMHCLGCPTARSESIADACAVHGINVDDLVDELNNEVSFNKD